jgi:predicted rRNA methylase YqxC with S4 and FtsJ domains
LREDIAVNLKLNEEEKEAILLISSNFEKLRRDFHKGLLGQKEYQIELNRLSNSILNLLT